MEFLALVGSRSYGLELATSDYDYFAVGSIAAPIPEKHCFRKTPEEMLTQMLLQKWEHPYALMPFFSPQIEANEETKDLILTNREALVRTYRKRLYHAYINMAESFLRHEAKRGAYYAKLNAYGLLWLDTLVRYASGRSFAEAHLPSAELRPFLLSVRHMEEGALAVLPEKVKEAAAAVEAVKAFYDAEEEYTNVSTVNTERCEYVSIKS